MFSRGMEQKMDDFLSRRLFATLKAVGVFQPQSVKSMKYQLRHIGYNANSDTLEAFLLKMSTAAAIISSSRI